MIIETILTPIFSFINVIVSLLPSLHMPSQITGALQQLITMISTLSYFVPITDLIICIAFIIAFKSFGLGWYVINWLVRKIPTIS